MLGVYIHIPFCKNICTYCDFCKMHYHKKYVTKYLQSLRQEINERYHGELIDTIYIGGGTPSSLSLQELTSLFEIINVFKLQDDYEFTIECNIEQIDQAKLKLFKEHRVNRISYGIESFSNKLLKILGRHHTKDMVKKNIALTKEYFNNINIDLIYGVTSDINLVKEDINEFLELDIPHISCYSLILEENTKLYIDNHKYIDEETDKLMYEEINQKLTKNGYHHYEISNYAKSGYESRHNTNYWLNGSYYGFGLGAVSYLHNYRISNTKNMTKYLNNNYQEEKHYEDIKLQKENDLILGLRLINGINYELFNQKYQTNLLEKEVIKELINKNMLKITNNYLACNYQYIYVLNNILVEILGSEL